MSRQNSNATGVGSRGAADCDCNFSNQKPTTVRRQRKCALLPRSRPLPLPPGLLRALAAIHGPHRPLTCRELAEFEVAKRAEIARAEARRQPSARTGVSGHA